MKKVLIFLVAISYVFFLTGCGKSEEDVIKKLSKKINGSDTYHITGVFELKNNEESYLYNINVDYKKEDNFKVSLVNQTNNHEQIILKNADGVYVLTPSLNKSFKFQSEWPYNNSQTYILQSLLKDIEDDSEKDVQKTENGYTITTSVNYSNKKDLVKQNIYLDKDSNITKVEVLDISNQPKIIMNFDKIDFNATIDDNYFKLENSVYKDETKDVPVSSIDGIVFPMYVPTDTYLTSQDIIETETGQRAILTFNGESPFTIIQETISNKDNFYGELNDGEPQLILDTVGVVSDSFVSWMSNGIEYHVISDELSQEELLSVANSISVMPISK